MRRVAIVGTTGSGKSTLAAQLARQMRCPHIELDALFWEPNWVEAPIDVFRGRVTAAVAGDTWVADGNYASKARDIVWGRADAILWLDYPLPLTMWRLVKRTFQRWATRQLLWGTNRESLREQLFTRRSLFLWALQTHNMHRKRFLHLFSSEIRPDQTVVHLRSPGETAKWLATWSLRGNQPHESPPPNTQDSLAGGDHVFRTL